MTHRKQKKTAINLVIPIITLNVNGLSSPIDRQRFFRLDKTISNHAVHRRHSLNSLIRKRLKVKKMERDIAYEQQSKES